MLLRLIAENIHSFKDAVEFNMFPSSHNHSHDNHKIACGHVDVLRMSAIYGANGAGKSNLIKALSFLKNLVTKDQNTHILFKKGLVFQLDSQYVNQPSGLAIEFSNNGKVFYYHIEVLTKGIFLDKIILEELFLCDKQNDIPLLSRNDSEISINPEYVGNEISTQLQEALKRMVPSDMLLFSFLGKFYPNENPLVAHAYQWFVNKLEVVLPNTIYGFVPHMLDTDSVFSELVNTIIPELNTGINKLIVMKKIIKEDGNTNEKLARLIKKAQEHPGEPQYYSADSNVVFEDGQIVLKTLRVVHNNMDDTEIVFTLEYESDGTRRLIEYMSLLYDIIQNDMVYVVDEIERSLHPIMIKSIMKKISESETAKGQLIFTTHESCLLDQSIFRPDEIWFAQKDVEQATQLYPLSDFNNIENTNIENGYLDGRYGGIPFLSNLKDLNW